MSNVAVLYHFFDSGQNSRDNLHFFLNFGYSKKVDFYFSVVEGSNIQIPELSNVKTIIVPNQSFDYGGFSRSISEWSELQDYDFVIFLNSSVRGPYVLESGPWWERLTGLLSEDVGLVGSSINILAKNSPHSRDYQVKYGGEAPFAHVQSMCFALSAQSLRILIAAGFFDSGKALNKFEAIRDYEIHLSRVLISAGFNLRCLAPEYNLLDYRKPVSEINPWSVRGDINNFAGYFGQTPSPTQFMFIKTNRGIYGKSRLKRIQNLQELQASSGKNELYEPALLNKLIPRRNSIMTSTTWLLSRLFAAASAVVRAIQSF